MYSAFTLVIKHNGKETPCPDLRKALQAIQTTLWEIDEISIELDWNEEYTEVPNEGNE